MGAVTEIRERVVSTNGVDLFVRDAGPEDGPVVVLAHGFPELGYSWRHVIGPIADAGYRVLVPDQRGYGRSSVPGAVDDYDIIDLTADLLGLLDDVGARSATFVGHDWGAIVVWQMSVLHPERVDGVVGVSVPFQRRGPSPPIARMRSRFAGVFFYMLYFQEPGLADAELGADPYRTMRVLFSAGSAPAGPEAAFAALADDGRGFLERIPDAGELPSWLTDDEVRVYADAFRSTGYTGPLSWYRNIDRNWELTAHLDGARVEVPALFLGGGNDPVLAVTPPAVMDGWVTDLRGSIVLDGAGHWLPQERPDDVSAAILEFLRGL
jgi:pimeloyl-ACP methyl ester carboxylesterase